MRGAMLTLLALIVGACAYKAEPIAAPAYDVVTSFSTKVPGKWLVAVESHALDTTVRPAGIICSAHNFPLHLSRPFATSVVQTLRNAFEEVEEIGSPIPGDQLRSRGARGIIVIRATENRARLDGQEGFWVANLRTQVLVVAAVFVDGPRGRLFGQTFEGQGTADAEAGMACSGGARALEDSAATAVRDAVRKIAEGVANSERVRVAR